MAEDAKAAKQRRLGEALRANLKRRKAAAQAQTARDATRAAADEAAQPVRDVPLASGFAKASGEKD